MKRKMCDDLFSQLDSLSVKPTGANEHTHTHTHAHTVMSGLNSVCGDVALKDPLVSDY